jgi:hypothetical protein
MICDHCFSLYYWHTRLALPAFQASSAYTVRLFREHMDSEYYILGQLDLHEPFFGISVCVALIFSIALTQPKAQWC